MSGVAKVSGAVPQEHDLRRRNPGKADYDGQAVVSSNQVDERKVRKVRSMRDLLCLMLNLLSDESLHFSKALMSMSSSLLL